jgi:hypothetical protein
MTPKNVHEVLSDICRDRNVEIWEKAIPEGVPGGRELLVLPDAAKRLNGCLNRVSDVIEVRVLLECPAKVDH